MSYFFLALFIVYKGQYLFDSPKAVFRMRGSPYTVPVLGARLACRSLNCRVLGAVEVQLRLALSGTPVLDYKSATV